MGDLREPTEAIAGQLSGSGWLSEFAYDPFLEQDLEPWERRWFETHSYEPEELER